MKSWVVVHTSTGQAIGLEYGLEGAAKHEYKAQADVMCDFWNKWHGAGKYKVVQL